MLMIIYVQVVFQIVNILIYFQMVIVLMTQKGIIIQILLNFYYLYYEICATCSKVGTENKLNCDTCAKDSNGKYYNFIYNQMDNVLVKMKNLKILF